MRRREPEPHHPSSGPRQRRPAPPPHDYRLVFEHSLIGMYRTTLAGEILDCNRSMARMLGYASRAELLGHRAADLYPAVGDRKAFLARLRRTGVLTNSELELRRKDGALIYVLENVRLVPGRGGSAATIQGAMVDVTDRRRAEQRLRESEHRYRSAAQALRRLTRRVEQVREADRARIARELHDELGQLLTALNMDLHWLQQRAGRGLDVPAPRVTAMAAHVTRCIQALRRICTDLRPPLLDDLGLVAAIEWQAREFQARTGVRCTVTLPKTACRVGAAQATAIFRILQESLTNVARHARATAVAISLRRRGRMLTLAVQDDGVGLRRAPGRRAPSLGMLGMQERASEWQGNLDIVAQPGAGTVVTLRMPLAPRSQESAS